MTARPEFAGLNKCVVANGLAAPTRRMHQAILRSYAHTGYAPTRAELRRLADIHRVDLTGALADLTAADLVVTDPDGAPHIAYPFSTAPTPHRVEITDGPTVYAMCAIDALGISTMLHRAVTITSDEPHTGKTILVHINRDQGEWTPPTAVVFAGATDDCCAPSADRTCRHINFFTSPEAAHDWAAPHPDITGITLDQHQALAYGIAEFGTLLHRQ